jgi:microcompartment protein CcmL/EutN
MRDPLPTASEQTALGMIECRSLARGAVVADSMLKTAAVHLLLCAPVSPGKLLVVLRGGVADVEAAVQVGLGIAGDWLEDALFIPALHVEVGEALLRAPQLDAAEALGIVETATVAAALRAADASLKSARVRLLSLRLAAGIGGKAIYFVSGSVADAQAAVEAGCSAVRLAPLLVHREVIAQPHPARAWYLASGPGRGAAPAGVWPPGAARED